MLQTRCLRLRVHEPDVPVHDWRTFLYREYGVAFESIDPVQAESVAPVQCMTQTFMLPVEAFPNKTQRTVRPKWLPKSNKPRKDTCIELFFGRVWIPGTVGDDYNLEVSARVHNPVYGYLLWLALILSILSIILSLLGLLL